MPKFAIQFPGFVTTTSLKTGLKFLPLTLVPIEVVFLGVYGAGSVAPADIQHEGGLSYLSAAGAGTLTAQTPERLDQGSRAAQGTYSVNASAEPTTYNAVPALLFGFNQRNGWMWGVPQYQGIKFDNVQTIANGGARVRSNAAGAVDLNAHVYEP